MNKLKVIATPIGNLDDINASFFKAIEQIEYLFCEDTRNTHKLLQLVGIDTSNIKLMSCHKFNERSKLEDMLNLIKIRKCGLISDAGYPAISDPGFILINACYENEIGIEIVNGTSALTHAIVQSGFDCAKFVFLGFLERQESAFKKEIQKYIELNIPIVLYESVHRIEKTISYLKDILENDHQVYIGRELTKKYEQVIRDKIANIDTITLKGEFVIVIDKYADQIRSGDVSLYLTELKTLIKYNMKAKQACKYLSEKHNFKANDLYNLYILKKTKN